MSVYHGTHQRSASQLQFAYAHGLQILMSEEDLDRNKKLIKLLCPYFAHAHRRSSIVQLTGKHDGIVDDKPRGNSEFNLKRAHTSHGRTYMRLQIHCDRKRNSKNTERFTCLILVFDFGIFTQRCENSFIIADIRRFEKLGLCRYENRCAHKRICLMMTKQRSFAGREKRICELTLNLYDSTQYELHL
jgi:hypothetical protein